MNFILEYLLKNIINWLIAKYFCGCWNIYDEIQKFQAWKPLSFQNRTQFYEIHLANFWKKLFKPDWCLACFDITGAACSSVIICTLRLWLHKSRGTGAWSWVISGYNCWCRYHNMETLAFAPARVWYLTSEIHNFKILTADVGFTQPKYFTGLLLQVKESLPCM